MNHHMENIGDPTQGLALLQQRFDFAQADRLRAYQLIDQLRATLAEVKSEACADQLRADQAEVEANALRLELEREKSITKRFSFMDELRWEVVNAVIDMHPDDLRFALLKAQSTPFGSLNAEMKRLTDACVALATEQMDRFPGEEVA